MSLRVAEVHAVVRELGSLRGAAVQKIRAPGPQSVVLELRQPGATQLVSICAEPEETRIHWTPERPASPPTPLPIQNLLRAHLLPSRLVDIAADEGERVVRLRFETPKGKKTLVAELLGRRGNLYLHDAEGKVLGAAVPGRHRPGERYEPPPPRQGAPPEDASRFAGDDGEPFPISRAIHAHYGPRAKERRIADRRKEAERALKRRLDRVLRSMKKVEEDLARTRDADRWRRLGDLLKPMLSRIPRGAEAVEATEYTEEGPRSVEVPLDPKLSPQENVERYYKRYRRMRAGAERIPERLAQLEAEARSLRESLAGLEAAEDEEAIAELLADAGEASRRGGLSPKDERKLPYRTFVSATGQRILVGRGAKQNDELTFRHARGSAHWLHARGYPGAHVVIPLPRGADPDGETLLDACALAAHFSGARGEAVAEITHAPVSRLRKPKGGAPGAVLLGGGARTVAYRHEDERIRRLLASET